ncbi:NfeD family protein [uncultured Odoribacter sp.]|uniref:NfeD family protein n=1 Tax=uncultured Odoribacter sp. TaxID=876416 RepID=UPI00261902E1|nr:NfeD family protein [uncultured Odoribacter sp.]
MEWIIVLMLVVIGFVLLILEFLVLPGVNVAGIIGFACVCFGVYLGYKFFGTKAGHFILLATAVGGFVVTWYALRAQTWKRLSLNSSIDSTVEGVDESVKVGDRGICLGRLAPMGKVKVGDTIVEALSQSGYIDSHAEVEVVKVNKDKIIVKLKKDKDG